jgi:alpha-1,2-mannosyltransferase
VVVAAACAACVWLLFVRNELPVDFMVFLHGAESVSHGVSPYVSPSSPVLWSGHAFVYPYFTAWLFVPFNGLSMSAAGLIYYALSVAAVLRAVRLVTGEAGGIVPLLLALTAEPVVRGFQLGTLNVWLLLGLAAAWHYRDRAAVAVLALTAVIVAKLFLLPMIAWLLITRRVIPAIATVVLSAGVIVLGCEVAGVSVSTFERMLSNLSAHEGPHSSSLTAALTQLDASGLALTVGPLLVAAAIVVFGWMKYRRGGDEAVVFSACVVASIVASPIVWTHYFTLLVLIPLVLGWPWQYQLLTLFATWLMETPDRAGALSFLHPFPGSGWLWAGLAAAGATIWHRHSRRAAELPEP